MRTPFFRADRGGGLRRRGGEYNASSFRVPSPCIDAALWGATRFSRWTDTALGQGFGGWIGDRLISRGYDETRTRKALVGVGFLMGLLLIPAVRAESAESLARAAYHLGNCRQILVTAVPDILVRRYQTRPHVSWLVHASARVLGRARVTGERYGRSSAHADA